MKLKTRIKISMVGIIAVMVVIYNAIIMGYLVGAYRKDMENSMGFVNEQKLITMNSLMNTFVTITEKPLFDDVILTVLRRDYNEFPAESRAFQQYLDFEAVNAQLYTEMFYENEYIYAITLFGFNSDTTYTKQRVGKGVLPVEWEQSRWYQQIAASSGHHALIFPYMEDDLYPGREPIISVGRLLNDPITLEPIGIIRVDVAVKDLEGILDSDSDYQVLLCSGTEDLLYTSLDVGDWKREYEELLPSHLVMTNHSEEYDLTITSLLPKERLTQKLRSTLLLIVVLTGAFAALVPVITELIARNSLKPISEINQLMKEVRAGDLTVRARVDSAGEFAEVCDSFNKMIIHTEQLIQQVELREREKMEAEYRELQAQISPHFILNTLNTIKWMAVMQGNKTIERALNSFSQLISFVVRERGEKIPIRKELEIMRYYVDILSLRYYDCFHIRFVIDENALDCYTIKYILQTLVENSVFHGFDATDHQIEIVIRINRVGGRIVYEVEDNGGGMSQERIEEVLNRGTRKEKSMVKIGIHNIMQRIKLIFGEEYGVSIRSELGKYTIVHVEIPALEVEDDQNRDRG